jgi:hypothetical protein
MKENKSKSFVFKADVSHDLISSFGKFARLKRERSSNSIRGPAGVSMATYKFDFNSSDMYLTYVVSSKGGVPCSEKYSASFQYSTGDNVSDVEFVTSELERLVKCYG